MVPYNSIQGIIVAQGQKGKEIEMKKECIDDRGLRDCSFLLQEATGRTEMTVLKQGSPRQVYFGGEGGHQMPDNFEKGVEEFQRQGLESRSEVDFLPSTFKTLVSTPSTSYKEKKKERSCHTHRSMCTSISLDISPED